MRASQSEVIQTSPSETSGIELREKAGEYLTCQEWQQRAYSAEKEVEKLKAAMRILLEPTATPPRPAQRVSSKEASVAEEIVDLAESSDARQRSKP